MYEISKCTTTGKFIDMATPQFTKMRWMLEECDYPDGEIGAIIFMGLLRGKSQQVILVGDWENQSFDITSCLKCRVPET